MIGVEKGSFGRYEEYTIRNAETGEEAIVTSLGSNLRRLTLSTGQASSPPMDLLRGYASPEELEAGKWSRGIKMIPFPNRIRDGVYEFRGRRYRLPINFPSQNHAIHGLLSRETMDLSEMGEGEESGYVSLTYDFDGKFEGYPFALWLEVRTVLSKGGLTVETTARNEGDDPLPFGGGWHPYFRFGDRSDVENWEITIPAESLVELDDRLIPTSRLMPLEGTALDFRRGRRIGDTSLDNIFTHLAREGGETVTRLSSPELGVTLEMWQEAVYGYLVVFTPPAEARDSVAIEPMTCNTNAFNSGEGLIVLQPGEEFHGRYGVRLREGTP